MQFTNFYVHCQQDWDDEWSCMCNDRCPVCNYEIEPYASLEESSDEPILHVRDAWVPSQGLPEGMESTQDLPGWPYLPRP